MSNGVSPQTEPPVEVTDEELSLILRGLMFLHEDIRAWIKPSLIRGWNLNSGKGEKVLKAVEKLIVKLENISVNT